MLSGLSTFASAGYQLTASLSELCIGRAELEQRVQERTRALGREIAEVDDNGLGIPPEHSQRVFEPFFRAHGALREGTGLGLSIVREAAQQLGSRVHLEGEPGSGTTVRVSIRKA